MGYYYTPLAQGVLTEGQLLALPAVIDVPTAGLAFGLSRIHAYELVKAGKFPVPVLKVGKRYRVPTAPILEALGIERPWTTHTDDTHSSTCDDEETVSPYIRKASRFGAKDHFPPHVTMRSKSGREVVIDPAKTYRYKGERITGAELIERCAS